MPELETLALFALAALILVVVPGPAVVYILTRSVSQGRGAGVISALGVNVGSTVHVAAAVAGLSVILAQSVVAFNAIKWAGVLYLAWIGIRTLRTSNEISIAPQGSTVGLRRMFVQGILVNVLNPKVAVFFLAFLPQFVSPQTPSPALETFILGMTLVLIGTVSDVVYALVGGGVGELFRTRPAFARRTRIGAGVTYLTLAGVAAVTGSR
jgi:threonine/homoserine/homoserine lactone efflux protein